MSLYVDFSFSPYSTNVYISGKHGIALKGLDIYALYSWHLFSVAPLNILIFAFVVSVAYFSLDLRPSHYAFQFEEHLWRFTNGRSNALFFKIYIFCIFVA